MADKTLASNRIMKECTVRGYYVYLLYDTRNKEIFYVGKGKGKRFFDHLKDAHKSGDSSVENKKIERIKQIGDNGLESVILRRNLTEQEAFQVEAATIDLLRSKQFRNIRGDILNIQSGHASVTNGMISVKQFKTMKTKYIEILRSETLLCLNVSVSENICSTSISQLIHSKKWKVKEEEARIATYTVVECENVVIAVFKSDSWKDNGDGRTCTFNGNQLTSPESLINRLISHRLPKRKRGTPQARYLNHTDIMKTKNNHK